MFPEGRKPGRGNENSGRKSKAEEFKVYIEKHKDEIKDEAISELAKSAIHKVLTQQGSLVSKDIALPIYLKGVKEKVDITSNDKTLNEVDDKTLDALINAYVARRKNSNSETCV